MRNPAYDTEENGGTLKELMMPDGVTTRASVYGRLYSSYETLTGDPAGALSAALLMPFPLEAPGRWSWMPWATASRWNRSSRPT